MSLSFLFCKPWHPATTWNQKKIWEAEQMDAKRKRDETTANKELQRESDRRRYEQMAGGKDPDPASAALNFMYAPPPGFQQPQEKEVEEDDEEVKKFKALAKMKSDPNFSAAASCSELEKLVGRRKNPGVSLAEQQERFPFLKDAPVEHAYAADVKVNFKPFNNVVRHVKCMRCGEWGHRSGDRECKLINDNPNDEERRLREDPMSQISAAGPETSVAGKEPAGEDADAAFLSTLSSKKKRRLLRLLQKMESAEGARSEGEEERKGKRKRNRKKEHRSSRRSDKKPKAHEERHALEQSRVGKDGGKGGQDKVGRRSHPKEQVRAGGRKGRATSSSEDECSDRDGSDGGRDSRRNDKKPKAHEERQAPEQSRVGKDGGKGGQDKGGRRSHPKEQVRAGGRKGRATPSSEDECSDRDGSDGGRERRERKRSKTSRREDGERRGVKSTRKLGNRDRDGRRRRGSERSRDPSMEYVPVGQGL